LAEGKSSGGLTASPVFDVLGATNESTASGNAEILAATAETVRLIRGQKSACDLSLCGSFSVGGKTIMSRISIAAAAQLVLRTG
jgi:hypothetical protein